MRIVAPTYGIAQNALLKSPLSDSNIQLYDISFKFDRTKLSFRFIEFNVNVAMIGCVYWPFGV